MEEIPNTRTVQGAGKSKTQIDYFQAHSLRDLLMKVNHYNEGNPSAPILREDIVDILKEEDTYILLYYAE